jgi:hypothetical protein
LSTTRRTPSGRPAVGDDFREAIQFVGNEWRIAESVIEQIRRGMSHVEKRGRNKYRVEAAVDLRLEALDIFLEHTTRPRGLEPIAHPSILRWFRAKASRRQVVDLPDEIWNLVLRFAKATVRWHRSALPEGKVDEDIELLSGLTLGRAVQLYTALFALGITADLYVRLLNHSAATLLGAPRERFFEILADAHGDVERHEVESFVRLMSYAGGSDSPHAKILVPAEGRILAPGGLMPAAGVERMLLRAAATTPSAFGEAGKRLGQRSFRRVPNVKLRLVASCFGRTAPWRAISM